MLTTTDLELAPSTAQEVFTKIVFDGAEQNISRSNSQQLAKAKEGAGEACTVKTTATVTLEGISSQQQV